MTTSSPEFLPWKVRSTGGALGKGATSKWEGAGRPLSQSLLLAVQAESSGARCGVWIEGHDSAVDKKKPCHLPQRDGSGGHYAKRHTSDREANTACLQTKHTSPRVSGAGNKRGVARGEEDEGVGERDGGVKTSTPRLQNKSVPGPCSAQKDDDPQGHSAVVRRRMAARLLVGIVAEGVQISNHWVAHLKRT